MPSASAPALGGPRPDHVAARPLAAIAASVGAAAPAGDVEVTGVTLDSRAVLRGDLYAALPGARAHGGDYAAAAAAAGAVAVLTDADGARRSAPAGLPTIVVHDPRAVLGDVAAEVFGQPARRLAMLAVTGTNGKTTTTCLMAAALRGAGIASGLVGTIETRIVDEIVPSVRTTPEAPQVHALLARMVERGARACAMEVSSHALALHRVDGVVFDVAAFTNLSQDHLDFHLDMEDYFAAKASLFTLERARCGVVCTDDAWGARLAADSGVPTTTVATLPDGPGWADAQWRAIPAPERGDGAFDLAGAAGVISARSPLPGAFNVANTAVALLSLARIGLEPAAAAAAMASARVPGRMERIGTARDRAASPGMPLAVVDYAHSPDAIAAALAALAGGGRPIVVVLGAGGDRDREKRAAMGEVAARGADVVVVTDDNPRSEDPAAIRAAVLAGARRAGSAQVLEVADRRAAIGTGVERAWSGGTLLVAGKGHEQGQEVAGTVWPFDDRAVLSEALATRLAEGGRRRPTGGTRTPEEPPS